MPKLPEMFDLTGRVAVVTGGAGLLGRQFCHTLAEAGAQVVGVDIDDQVAGSLAEELNGAGYKALSVGTDISSPESVSAMAQKTLEAFQRLDILVNSAALDPKFDQDNIDQQGANAFERASQSLMYGDSTEQTDLALVALLVERGWLYIRLGRIEEAEAVLAQCRAIYRRLDIPPVPGEGTDSLLPLGIIALIRGDYVAADQIGEEARRLSEAHNHICTKQ